MDICNRGIEAFENGDCDLAITCFTEAIRLGHVSAYYNRGTAYAHKGEYDRAIADFTEAIRLNPNDVAACINRGLAYDQKGELTKALADCNLGTDRLSRCRHGPTAEGVNALCCPAAERRRCTCLVTGRCPPHASACSSGSPCRLERAASARAHPGGTRRWWAPRPIDR